MPSGNVGEWESGGRGNPSMDRPVPKHIAPTDESRRLATCTCRECGLVFKMHLRWVWMCRDNDGPHCPNNCNGTSEAADGSSTIDVDA